MYSNLNHNSLYGLIFSGDKLAAKELMGRCEKKGYSLNPKKGHMEQTLFQLVVRKDLTDIAIYFMEQGVQVNTQDKLGGTPLHEAVKNGNKILVEKLLEKGANPFVYDRNGATPWMLAGHKNHVDLAFRLSPGFLSNYPNLFFTLKSPSQKNSTQSEWLDLSNQDRPLDLSMKSCVRK